MARTKKQLHEYCQNVTEISEDQFNDAERDDVLTLKCSCGKIYHSAKSQISRRLSQGKKLNCRSCVNRINGGM